MQEVRDKPPKGDKPRRGWGPPIAGVILAVTALSLDTISPLTRRLPVHWVPVLGVAGGLMLACWPWAWRLMRRAEPLWLRWPAVVLALIPPASLCAYLLWTPPLLSLVPVPPMAFSSAGQRHLVYEIRVKHYGFLPLRLQQVRILAEDGTLLRTVGAGELADSPSPGSSDRTPGDAALPSPDAASENRAPSAGAFQETLNLPAGRDTTLFLWLALTADEPLPDHFHHQLLLADPGAPAPAADASQQAVPQSASQTLEEPLVVDGPSTARRRNPRLPVLEAPLRGGPWLARGGPSNRSPHRRARALGHISQRFAVDWVMLSGQGQSRRPGTSAVSGRPARNQDYLAWGREVRAAFSGTVAAKRDGAPDHPPGGPGQPVNLSNFAGNYLVVRHDDGYCAFYGHLQSGSITLEPGERVFSQRLLGKIGNSGDSKEPHLHFQVADDCDWLRSEGLPYHLESYRSHGLLAGQDGFALAPPGPPVRYQLPLRGQVVTFPEE